MAMVQQCELTTNSYLYCALHPYSGLLASPLICLHSNAIFLAVQVKKKIKLVSIIAYISCFFTSLGFSQWKEVLQYLVHHMESQKNVIMVRKKP